MCQTRAAEALQARRLEIRDDPRQRAQPVHKPDRGHLATIMPRTGASAKLQIEVQLLLSLLRPEAAGENGEGRVQLMRPKETGGVPKLHETDES
jgi:hypothetical protein